MRRYRFTVRRLEVHEVTADNLQHAAAKAHEWCRSQHLESNDHPLVHDALRLKAVLLGVEPVYEVIETPRAA